MMIIVIVMIKENEKTKVLSVLSVIIIITTTHLSDPNLEIRLRNSKGYLSYIIQITSPHI